MYCHANFRSIFLIDKSSLRDQGKDVSRALRNRCIEILIDYDNGFTQNNIESLKLDK